MFRRDGVEPTSERLLRYAGLCALFTVAGFAIGASGEWWGWVGAAMFALAGVVVFLQWLRVRD
ncbi:MAG: hypothetical protein CL416_00550 [Acidimicrobiaceae bacterium]|nr:hypothetical protein [Acidimicrobiaceae bacterium]